MAVDIAETFAPWRASTFGGRGGPSASRGSTALPVRGVARWRELVDYPSTEQHEALGLAYLYDHARGDVTITCAQLGIQLRTDASDAAEAIAPPQDGDQLGGWPAWIQGADYPSCPRCDARTVLVLQVDSDNNIPHLFGDAGCGHITQCPDHPEVLAFAWACC